METLNIQLPLFEGVTVWCFCVWQGCMSFASLDNPSSLTQHTSRSATEVLLQNFKLRRQMQDIEARASRPPQFGMKGGPRDVSRPYIPYNNNRPPFHSPPMQRPYTRRPPVDSAQPPKRGMAPDRRDEGDRFSSRQRAR